MQVLVTGGSGVVEPSTVTALVQRGHLVRLLSRHAERDAKQWPHGVAPWPGDITTKSTIRGAAEGCDAVVHLAAVADEHPPDITFERVNVQGTGNVVHEARRADVRRFVYVSSLGAERGSSRFHRSKLAGEEIARAFEGHVILRPGPVYGPGDEHISVLLRMMRTLPAIPVVGDGDRPFQPLWHEDLAEAIAIAVGRDDLAGRTLELAGPDRTTQRDLMDRLHSLLDREPLRVPIPDFVASLGLRAAESLGLGVAIVESEVWMLTEGNVIEEGRENALETVLGVRATPLDRGLALLADAGPEQLPSEGFGPLERQRFWADIRGAQHDADGLFALLRSEFDELMPRLLDMNVETTSPSRLEEGETLTLGLPLGGQVQARVAEIAEHSITLLTLQGHPLAGAVRFLVEQRGDAVRFEVQIYDRAASAIDLLLLRAFGDRLQGAIWRRMVSNVVAASGGQTDGVQHERETLDHEQARRIEEWAENLGLRA